MPAVEPTSMPAAMPTGQPTGAPVEEPAAVDDSIVIFVSRLKDIVVEATVDPVVLNGKVFFVGSDGIAGYELWITDGTEIGTTKW